MMGGFLICYATECTKDMTPGEFAVGLLIAAAVVAGIVLLVKWLIPDDKDKDGA